MILQTVNRSDAEKVWVNVTNVDGQTITAHHPVFMMTALGNTNSIGTNEAVLRPRSSNGDVTGFNPQSSFIGLAFEDIPNNDVGQVQVYGYHESVALNPATASVTINIGDALGAGGGTDIACDSAALNAAFNNVMILDTAGAAIISLMRPQPYGNHVFIRGL